MVTSVRPVAPGCRTDPELSVERGECDGVGVASAREPVVVLTAPAVGHIAADVHHEPVVVVAFVGRLGVCGERAARCHEKTEK